MESRARLEIDVVMNNSKEVSNMLECNFLQARDLRGSRDCSSVSSLMHVNGVKVPMQAFSVGRVVSVFDAGQPVYLSFIVILV